MNWIEFWILPFLVATCIINAIITGNCCFFSCWSIRIAFSNSPCFFEYYIIIVWNCWFIEICTADLHIKNSMKNNYVECELLIKELTHREKYILNKPIRIEFFDEKNTTKTDSNWVVTNIHFRFHILFVQRNFLKTSSSYYITWSTYFTIGHQKTRVLC